MTSERRPNTEMLRHEIDSGRTGSKVAFEDPAAAPLGTDDEAGGHSTPPERVAQAIAEERFARPSDTTRPRDRPRHAIGHAALWLLVIVVVIGGVLVGVNL